MTTRATGCVDRLPFVAIVVICLLQIACAATTPSAAEPTPLRILLTNDDGYDSPGIKTVHEALVAAGHDVTRVAPLSNQSGSGLRVTTQGTLDYKEQSTGVWSVDGSPADSVLVGVLQVMKDDPPDIVISGANFGPNLGYAGSSGTVGAATMAMYVGLPAIAISVGVDPAEQSAEPIPFPSTFRAFAGAAEFILKVIRDLQQARVDNGNLIPKNAILNVNYPPADPEEIQGFRVLQATWDAGVRIAYEETGEAEQLKIQLQLMEPGAPRGDDVDWQWFARGYITISVLDGNSDAGASLRDAVARRLSKSGIVMKGTAVTATLTGPGP
ncbi:MAG: 5'/3'-nucleotidase SurE [Gammaproteobacteria bacterium]|nr:5'/3'-nucleotidase SurE [Gammaproteobacteria bacterium]